MEDRTTEQFFEDALTDALGEPSVKKELTMFPMPGEYVFEFGALDETIEPKAHAPNCLITSHLGIKVPFTIVQAKSERMVGQTGTYVFWFTTKIGSNISLDNICKIGGLDRVADGTVLRGSHLIGMARQLNGCRAVLRRGVRQNDEGRKFPDDRWFSMDSLVKQFVTIHA